MYFKDQLTTWKTQLDFTHHCLLLCISCYMSCRPSCEYSTQCLQNRFARNTFFIINAEKDVDHNPRNQKAVAYPMEFLSLQLNYPFVLPVHLNVFDLDTPLLSSRPLLFYVLSLFNTFVLILDHMFCMAFQWFSISLAVGKSTVFSKIQSKFSEDRTWHNFYNTCYECQYYLS